jgi:uncharacterized protein DUF4333
VPPRAPLLVLPALALPLAVAACGGVDDGKLEAQIKDQVTKQGGRVVSVDCPADQDLKKGNAFDCVLKTARGESVSVRVKITSEDNGGRAVYVIPPDVLRP